MKRKIAEGIKDLTSLNMQRGTDIEKKKFLVELEEGLFDNLNSAVADEGISRNLLVNLLIEYFLANREEVISKLKP